MEIGIPGRPAQGQVRHRPRGGAGRRRRRRGVLLVNQAQQQAGEAGAPEGRGRRRHRGHPGAAGDPAGDVAVREVPLDATNANGVVTDPKQVIGRIPAVTILQGQLVTTNMLASSSEGGQFSILGPGRDASARFRGLARRLDDRPRRPRGRRPAQGRPDRRRLRHRGRQRPARPRAQGQYTTDRSTKITYQDIVILARKDAFYIVRAPLPVAEEIAHLQATGTATFSLALRPDEDHAAGRRHRRSARRRTRSSRSTDCPIPEPYPAGNGPIPTPPTAPDGRADAPRRRPRAPPAAPSPSRRRPPSPPRPYLPRRPSRDAAARRRARTTRCCRARGTNDHPARSSPEGRARYDRTAPPWALPERAAASATSERMTPRPRRHAARPAPARIDGLDPAARRSSSSPSILP